MVITKSAAFTTVTSNYLALNIRGTLPDVLHWAVSSFGVCAEENLIRLLLVSGAGFLIGCSYLFLCGKWIFLFNRHYAMTLPQKVATIIMALTAGFLAPLWLAVDFAQDAIKLDLRQRLSEITRDPLVMNEMRAHFHASLEQLSPQIGMLMVDPPQFRAEEELRFSTRPSNGSILITANAYSDALFFVMGRKGGLLPHFVSWASLPSFLAADIRMHATGKPQQAYDLSPEREALLDILTVGLAAKVGALQLVIRLIFLVTILALTTLLLLWLAISAYGDIRVHLPSHI